MTFDMEKDLLKITGIKTVGDLIQSLGFYRPEQEIQWMLDSESQHAVQLHGRNGLSETVRIGPIWPSANLPPTE